MQSTASDIMPSLEIGQSVVNHLQDKRYYALDLIGIILYRSKKLYKS